MSIAKILIGSTAVIVLAGCGGSSSKSSQSTTPSNSASASSSSGGTLSKADFVTQMNKICKDTDDRVQALPQPADLTDYATVITNLNGTTKEIQGYLTQLDIFVPKSPDAAELQTKWVTPEKAELTKFTASAAAVIADAQAKDAAKLQADTAALSQTGSDSKTIAAYLTSYGLTECASLEDS